MSAADWIQAFWLDNNIYVPTDVLLPLSSEMRHANQFT